MSSLTHQTKAPQQLESLIPTPACITDNMEVWTSAIKTKSATGRGSSKKRELYGIKKLRELILELAVRGKLIPQDPTDEPASVLLERIAAEKAQLVKQGKIKKQKPLPAISEDEKPFVLPDSWKWCYLSDIGEIVSGGTPKSSESEYWSDNGIKWLTPADLYNLKGKYISSGRRDISELGLKKSSAQMLPIGSVLFSSRAPIGYVAITSTELSTNQGFKSINPFFKSISEYLYCYLKRTAKYIDEQASGTTFKEVSGKYISQVTFPLPPEKEQHRIVAKVNELMALCDQLESETDASIEAHQTLVTTLLTTLTDSQNADELMQNWALISEHFDLLFTTEQSIEQLKQSILQLAVMGKLVPQDPADEPASVLLERIAAEKAQLVKQGKIKKQKTLSPITEEELDFEIPVNWSFIRLSDIVDLENGDRSKNYPNKSLLVDSGIPFVNAGHLNARRISLKEMTYITAERFDLLRAGKFNDGDILFCLRGSLGKSALVENFGVGAIASSLVIVRPNLNIFPDYLIRFFESPNSFNQIKKYNNGTAQPNLSAADLGKFVFPLPPEKEQHRIVAKVNELMALCDAMKSKLQTNQQTQLSLADALIANSL